MNSKAKNTNQYPIKHIHIIGAGTMGGDIAIWCVLQGFTVSIQDLSVEQIARVMKKASRDFNRKFKNKYKQKSLLDNLIPDLIGSGIEKADVIIEAATENLEVKRNIFSEIERKAKSTALLCSNTSSIKIEEISKKLKDPNRLVGVHFFNPVLKMPLVEIIKSNECDQNFLNFAINFTSRIKNYPSQLKVVLDSS
jgi:3-hydroxyacyl-CoA dehydrogenase/enoyl-CoA hydratase/3-hydroxybutyryl-CoA epimerase